MTNQTSTPALFGGSLIVAIDLADAILFAVMAVEDAVLCGLIDEAALTAPDGALNGAPDGAAREALMDEDTYLDWLAEKWGYTDGDVRLDAVTSHFGRG